jgi:branched-chain amino acid transport system permease protein
VWPRWLSAPFFAGVAGGLWAHLVTAITPKSFSLVLAFHIVVMVVVGGSGSITGSAVAAVVFSVLTEFFRPMEERLNIYGLGEIFMALVMICILIYRPAGNVRCPRTKRFLSRMTGLKEQRRF